jgi:NCS1 family nucleobase:cation symporter-1
MVLQTGALLAPGLGLSGALLAIFLGTLVGVLLLAAVGVIGSDTGLSPWPRSNSASAPWREPAGAAQPAATDRLGLVRNHRHARCRQPAGRAGVQRRQPAGQPDAVDAVFGALATLLAVSGPLTFVRRSCANGASGCCWPPACG